MRKPEERRARGGWRLRREDDNKMGLQETIWEAVNWVNGSGYQQLEGCCVHGNEHSGSLKCGKRLDWRTICWSRTLIRGFVYLFIYLPFWMTHFQALKRWERTNEENKEKVRQKEVWREGGRNEGRRWWTRERIRAWRMERKHKNQGKEVN